MADIIAMFSRWAKSGLSALLDLQGRGRLSSYFDGLASSSMEPNRCSAMDDFQRIMRMLPRIEAMLGDAEERDIQDRSVKLWLSELRLLAYDIDDVVDEYEYDQVLRAQIEATAAEEAYHLGKRKRSDYDHHDEDEQREGRNMLASSSSQVPAISDGMAEKIREIRERFDEIERDRKALRLREEDGVKRFVAAQMPPLTSSHVDESSVIGRESDKEKIVDLLLSNSESRNKTTIVTIVGMGGVGKTTLAQLIYNDPRICCHFDLRKWIYVNEDFDPRKLASEIYPSMTKNSWKADVLQDSIKKEVMKFQRMFLVLDDVWNEKQHLWEFLQVSFDCASIVKVLITTRNEKVADVMHSMKSFHLDFLSEEEGWRLFQQCALCDDENLMKIGKRIVNKCGGLPLAIKLLGSHLQFERDEDKWMSILENELWDLDPGANEILPALRFSYQRMPIHLKPCFRYCSMFPKNEMLDKNRLVWLWVAQGYIQPKTTGKTVEETGREYFDELLRRSFFQATRVKNKNFFVMHDLILDLAIFISGEEFSISTLDKEFNAMRLEGGKQNKYISNNVHHLTIHDHPTNNEALKGTLVYPFLSHHVVLRSIFYHGYNIINDLQLSNSIRLRALHVHMFIGDSNAFKFLDSIASIKHLRYLCLSNLKYAIKGSDQVRLFNSFHGMYNLQALDLSGNLKPVMLHTSINNLINLRHLVLPVDSFMPCGIRKLTHLQTLKYVTVKDGSYDCGGIGEIEDLASLTGSCCINGIYFATDVVAVKKANLNRKKHIWRVCLDWYFVIDLSFDVFIKFNHTHRTEQERDELAEAMLEALQPHNSLRELEIHHYPVIQFPLWLGYLPCLQSIFITGCAKLKNIKLVKLPLLKSLLVQECPELTEVHGLCNLHRLEKLKISECHNLFISAKERLPSKLQSVCFKACWKLTLLTGLQNLHSLEILKLIKCPKLQLSLNERLATMPRVVEIIDCLGLREWCQSYGFEVIQEISKLKELTIHYSKLVTSDYGSGNLTSLEILNIDESFQIYFPEEEWIPRCLHTLHLRSCRWLKFFPWYQNLSTLRLFKIWDCTALIYLPGLQMMESLEKLEIIDCPQFTLSPIQRLPSKLKFLLISNCPRLLWLPGLQELFFLRDLKLHGCCKLMLLPLEQLPFIFQVKLEIINCPNLREWCRRYNLSYNKMPHKTLFAWSSQQINLWIDEAFVLLGDICVLDYDKAILETEKWPAFQLVGFYICSCAHLKSITFGRNFTILKQLRIWNCSHLQELNGLFKLTSLQDIDISKCPNLSSLLDFPISLQSLAIDRCNKIFSLLCGQLHLSSLEISSCSKLSTIKGLQHHASLRFIKITKCPQLQEWCQKQHIAYFQD